MPLQDSPRPFPPPLFLVFRQPYPLFAEALRARVVPTVRQVPKREGGALIRKEGRDSQKKSPGVKRL